MTIQFQNSFIPPSVQRAYDVSIRTATAVSGGFSGATVFRATTIDGRELAVRRTPRSVALPPERMKRLYRLLRQISQAGFRLIPVPFLPARAASPVPGGVDPSFMPWLQVDEIIWQIEPWMPGTSLSGDEVTTLDVSAALIALNQFHQLATKAVRVAGSDDWFVNATKPSPAVLRRLSIVNELTHGVLDLLHRQLSTDSDERFRGLAVRVCKSLRTWLPWLHRELTALATISFPIQPVLRDVWRAHVLFTDNEVTGLIDLSAAASDHVTVDVTRLVRSWYGTDVAKIQKSMEEYQSLRILNASELRLLQVLDASTVLLSPVTWLRRRMESCDTANVSNEVIARLVELTIVAETFNPLPFVS